MCALSLFAVKDPNRVAVVIGDVFTHPDSNFQSFNMVALLKLRSLQLDVIDVVDTDLHVIILYVMLKNLSESRVFREVRKFTQSRWDYLGVCLFFIRSINCWVPDPVGKLY